MKTTLFTFGAAILFVAGATMTSSYAGSGHEKGKHHAGGHAGGHMDHMNDVLQTLKTELGDKYNQPVPAATKDQLALGKKIFTKSCVTCHGEGGKGDGPAAAAFKKKPADFTDAEHSKFYSDQGRIHIIKKGVKDTPMPAWESMLKEQEILSVHAYIRSLRSSASVKKQGHGEHKH